MRVFQVRQSVSGSQGTGTSLPHPTTLRLGAPCFRPQVFGAVIVIAALASAWPAPSFATQKIEALFEKFDQLAGAAPQVKVPTTTAPSCGLSFGEMRKKVDEYVQARAGIEREASALNERYKAIIADMPRVGARDGACNKRMTRDIEKFRDEIAALNLASMSTPINDMVGCIVSFRQKVAEKEQEFATTEVATSDKIKLSKQKKAITDLDYKRSEVAVFLDQVEGFLSRRLSEIEESEQINCSEGDAF